MRRLSARLSGSAPVSGSFRIAVLLLDAVDLVARAVRRTGGWSSSFRR